MEHARLAEEADLGPIAEIAERVGAELGAGRGGPLFLAREAFSPSPLESLRVALSAADSVAVAGCYDDVVCGYGIAHIEQLGDGTTIGMIAALAVEPEMRAVGIGEAMMNLLLDRLRAAGCSGVDSWALPGDRHTKNFFESFGLKARLLTVHRRLDDDAGTET